MNSQMKLVVALTLMLLPAGAAVARASSSQSDREQPRVNISASPSKSSNGQMSMLISDEVRHQLLLLSNYGIFDWIECDINADRSATLRGQVTRPTLKSDAENALRKIEGIPNVNNQIEVLPISPADDQIRIAVYRSIFRYEGPLFRYATQSIPPIHIIVNNGRVTLKGVVATEADSQQAYTAANGVSGVFEVKNELRVNAKG
jgi:osmotically-inducible protein OsmY